MFALAVLAAPYYFVKTIFYVTDVTVLMKHSYTWQLHFVSGNNICKTCSGYILYLVAGQNTASCRLSSHDGLCMWLG
jgi:hypothetical protein